MALLDLNIPSFKGDLSDEKAMRRLTSYLYKLDEQLRFVLSNLGEDNLSDSLRAVINTNVDAKTINELTGQLQRLGTQITQTADKITLKASKEELDALENVLNESVAAFEVTAKAIRSEVSSTASGLRSQINQQAEQITLKASKEEVQTVVTAAGQAQADANNAASAAGQALSMANSASTAAANAQNTAESAQANTQALAQRVTKAESEIAVQADEIALRVTKTQYETGLDGKLDADKPSVGVQTASAVVNEKGVYLSGGEIDMRTSDGEEYVNITDSGVTASSMGAPDVMPRYAGPTVIYVNPLATSEEIAAGATYRNLKNALETISGRFVPYGVTIRLQYGMTEYDDLLLQNAVFPAGLAISAEYTGHAKLMGQFSVSGCSGKLTVQFLDIQAQEGANRNGYFLQGAGLYAHLEHCTIRGLGDTSSRAVYAADGAGAYVTYCEMYDCGYALYGDTASRCVAVNNMGNCTICASTGSDVSVHGSVPSASASKFDATELIGGRIRTQGDAYIYVNQGSGGSAPAVPVIVKITVSPAFAGSFKADGSKLRNDPAQGWLNGAGRIKGVIAFSTGDIIEFRNKTILSASLRLSMKSSGRGTAVAVELYGTQTQSSVNAPVLGSSYGVIANMSPGETLEITLPAQALTDLSSGATRGIVLYSSDTGSYKERDYSKNYAVFTGSDGSDDKKPILTVTYEG